MVEPIQTVAVSTITDLVELEKYLIATVKDHIRTIQKKGRNIHPYGTRMDIITEERM
jgi:single-stranded DNA-specific DHH superfamily exonuclease